MKVAPVSADLLIKAAGVLLLIGGGVYLLRRVSGAVSQGVGSALDVIGEQAATTFNPASTENFVYGGVNAIGAWATDTPASDWTLGGWIYDLTHTDPLISSPPPRSSGGASGSW